MPVSPALPAGRSALPERAAGLEGSGIQPLGGVPFCEIVLGHFIWKQDMDDRSGKSATRTSVQNKVLNLESWTAEKGVASHGQAPISLCNAGCWVLLAGFGSWTASVRSIRQPVSKVSQFKENFPSKQAVLPRCPRYFGQQWATRQQMLIVNDLVLWGVNTMTYFSS